MADGYARMHAAIQAFKTMSDAGVLNRGTAGIDKFLVESEARTVPKLAFPNAKGESECANLNVSQASFSAENTRVILSNLRCMRLASTSRFEPT